MPRRDISKARSLRLHSTEAEKFIWSKIRNRQPGNLKFKRQFPIPPYIVDFCCLETKLIIEVDGGQHTPEADFERTRFLESQGYKIVRFWNNDVLNNIEGVVSEILKHTPHPNPLPQEEMVFARYS